MVAVSKARKQTPGGSYRYKRLLDLTVLLVGHVALLPLWLLLWAAIPLAIIIDSGWPVFYRQERLTRGGRPFAILKFRTMVRNAEQISGPVWAAERDPRVTRA